MPCAKLTITTPGSVWISEVSRAYPDTGFRALAATAKTSTGVALIEIRGNDPESIRDEIREYDSVTDLTVFETEPGTSRDQIDPTAPYF